MMTVIYNKAAMVLTSVSIETADDGGFVLGQTQSVEPTKQIEAVVQEVSPIQCGFVFCDASGKTLRWSGNDVDLIELAQRNALALSAKGAFIVVFRASFSPQHVLKEIQRVPKISRVYCGTTKSSEVVVAETDEGREIVGVFSGGKNGAVDDFASVEMRKNLLRRAGFELKFLPIYQVEGVQASN